VTQFTEINQRDFKDIINKVRTDDYCIARDTHEVGIHAIAVPLRNMQGQTLAALNVVGTPEQFSDLTIERKWLPMLRDAARELRGLL
jgi:IclR family pca regulon transcriptional regulator